MLAAQSKLSLSVRMALRWTRLEGARAAGAGSRASATLGAAALQPPSCVCVIAGYTEEIRFLNTRTECDFPSVIAICINFYLTRRFLLLTTHRRRQSSLLLRLMPACQPARPTVPFLSSSSSCPLRPSPHPSPTSTPALRSRMRIVEICTLKECSGCNSYSLILMPMGRRAHLLMAMENDQEHTISDAIGQQLVWNYNGWTKMDLGFQLHGNGGALH